MHYKESVSKENRTVMIAGKERTVTIEVSWSHDDSWSSLEDLLGEGLTEEETKEYQRKLDSYDLSVVLLEVKASFANCTGYDYQGQVFMTDSAELLDCVTDYDMIGAAIKELEKDIENQIALLVD